MRLPCQLLTRILFCLLPASVLAQNLIEREAEFLSTSPLVGEMLPDVSIYSADGKPFSTASLRGHYTVLTFGCLTCPPSMWNIAGLEAVQRDYESKGVKFFFIYKALAHPELAGNYVQPFTIEERLAHAKQAKQQFDTRIPWLVDAMDNRLKRALGDRPNSQFLIDPAGRIVSKRAWSNPPLVRTELEKLVGKTDKVTRVEDLNLKFSGPMTSSAKRNVVPRVSRNRMNAIVIEPLSESREVPYYAKLRAEVNPNLLASGAGEMYLGFHLDPFQDASWNNLGGALTVQLEANENVQIASRKLTAPLPPVSSDGDPREFLIDVSAWPTDQSITVIVKYFVCNKQNEECYAVQQKYRLHRKRDIDGGGARGEGAGYWDAKEFTSRLLMGDENKDGQISKLEAAGIIAPHFEQLDTDHDGLLNLAEMSVVADWLNYHHQPRVPTSQPRPK